MKNTESENKPWGGKRNNEGNGKTRSDKKSQGIRGTKLFRNGSEPDENVNPIKNPKDYRLRANRPGTLEQESRGHNSKEGKRSAYRNKANSVQAEMRIRSGHDDRKMREKQ